MHEVINIFKKKIENFEMNNLFTNIIKAVKVCYFKVDNLFCVMHIKIYELHFEVKKFITKLKKSIM